MAKLSYGERKRLPAKDFALPAKRSGGKGGYPIPNASHARNALFRVSEYGTPAEKAEVRAKVHRKFPSIGEKSMKHSAAPPKASSFHTRGHHETHRKEADRAEMSHADFEALDHGGKHDHMPNRPKGHQGGNARVGLLAFLAAALLPLIALGANLTAGGQPYGIFGGTSTFAALPGNTSISFTATPSSTSGTLTANWTGTTGSYVVVFSDFESRSVTLTKNATTATWSGSITGTPSKTATVDGFTTVGGPTFAFTSDLGLVWSNGSGWFATAASYGPAPTISSGCATVSAIKGMATSFQFATSGTSCIPVIQLPPAPNGWACFAQDVTHNVVFTQTASTIYSCTVTGTTTASDVVQVIATPY